jgi:hypothetical protein
MNVRHLEKSRTFPTSVESAYQSVLVAPLPRIFKNRHWAIPPIVEVLGQDGEWGTSVGQTRTIKQSDGGRLLETLTVIEPPHQFGYNISPVKGPLKLLVASASGTWAFTRFGQGVRITWSWDITPTKWIGRAAMPVLSRLWLGYANKAMVEIDSILSAEQQPE